jgi:hypothetical protein
MNPDGGTPVTVVAEAYLRAIEGTMNGTGLATGRKLAGNRKTAP